MSNPNWECCCGMESALEGRKANADKQGLNPGIYESSSTGNVTRYGVYLCHKRETFRVEFCPFCGRKQTDEPATKEETCNSR